MFFSILLLLPFFCLLLWFLYLNVPLTISLLCWCSIILLFCCWYACLWWLCCCFLKVPVYFYIFGIYNNLFMVARNFPTKANQSYGIYLIDIWWNCHNDIEKPIKVDTDLDWLDISFWVSKICIYTSISEKRYLLVPDCRRFICVSSLVSKTLSFHSKYSFGVSYFL